MFVCELGNIFYIFRSDLYVYVVKQCDETYGFDAVKAVIQLMIYNNYIKWIIPDWIYIVLIWEYESNRIFS